MPGRKSFLLRISQELWTDLEIWAKDELRSVNGQIEFLLKRAVQQRRRDAKEGAPPGGKAEVEHVAHPHASESSESPGLSEPEGSSATQPSSDQGGADSNRGDSDVWML